MANNHVCMGACTKELCCSMPTTTPLTCASFTCVAPWIPEPDARDFPCAANGCTKEKCCLCLTTTPCTTTTPMPTTTQPCDTNAPPAVASPCTTKAIRLYSAQQIPGVSENAPEKFSTAQGTTVGFLTIFAVAGLSAGLGVSIFKHVRRNYRRTGVPTQVDSLEDGAGMYDSDGLPLLNDPE